MCGDMLWIVGDQEAGGNAHIPPLAFLRGYGADTPICNDLSKDLSVLCGLPPSLELQRVVWIIYIPHHSLVLTQQKMPHELSE